jgi:hypothetical protein
MLPSVIGGPWGCLGFMFQSLPLASLQFALDRLTHKIGAILIALQYSLNPLERPGREPGRHIFAPLASSRHPKFPYSYDILPA